MSIVTPLSGEQKLPIPEEHRAKRMLTVLPEEEKKEEDKVKG